jgi:hypothetical protein
MLSTERTHSKLAPKFNYRYLANACINFSVVFIHGLSGDREKTWTGPNQTEPWPKTILPGRLPTARILAFGYDSKWLKDSSSRNRVQEHASNLLASLGQHRDNDNTVGLTNIDSKSDY